MNMRYIYIDDLMVKRTVYASYWLLVRPRKTTVTQFHSDEIVNVFLVKTHDDCDDVE